MEKKALPSGSKPSKQMFAYDMQRFNDVLTPFSSLNQKLDLRNNLNGVGLSPNDAEMYRQALEIINETNESLRRYGLKAIGINRVVIDDVNRFCTFLESIPPEPLEPKSPLSANPFRFWMRNAVLYGITNQLSWWGDIANPEGFQVNYLMDLLSAWPKIRTLLIAKNLHQDDVFCEVEHVLQVAKQGYLQEFNRARKMLLLISRHRSHLPQCYEHHSTKDLVFMSSSSIMIDNLQEYAKVIKQIYFKIQSLVKEIRTRAFGQQLCLDLDKFIKRELVQRDYNIQVLGLKKYDDVIDHLKAYYYDLELYQQHIQSDRLLDGVVSQYNFFAWEEFLETLYSYQIRELAAALQHGTCPKDPVVSAFWQFIETYPEIKPAIGLELHKDYNYILFPQYENFDHFERKLMECIYQGKSTEYIEQQLRKQLGLFLKQHNGGSILQTLHTLKIYVERYDMFDREAPDCVLTTKLFDLPTYAQKNIIEELSKLKELLKPFNKYIGASTLSMFCSDYELRQALHYFGELKSRLVVGTECSKPYLKEFAHGKILLAEYMKRAEYERPYLEKLLWDIDCYITAIEFFVGKP